MKSAWLLAICLMMQMTLQSCDNEIRNLAERKDDDENNPVPDAKVIPININEKGIEFLEKMPGHWTGTNLVMTDQYDWFAFDYRPISPSHVHGIFEGGTFGNLFTSFFIADFEGTHTLMARNGGILSGIYRTSYFVLDSVDNNSSRGDFYRFVDAEGGRRTMWMELRFVKDSLYFNAYTSGLGRDIPRRHMTFKALKGNLELAEHAANAVDYPVDQSAVDFNQGFEKNYLQAAEGAKSATFLAQDLTGEKDIFTLAYESGDPFTIEDHPYLAYLNLQIERTADWNDKTLFVNLSKRALTDDMGYFVEDATVFNDVLMFSELDNNEDEFLFTYVHPGEYYVNVVVDLNDDGMISAGDMTNPAQSILIEPEGQHQIVVSQFINN